VFDNATVGVLAAVVIALELWRRTLRNRAARWVHRAVVALCGIAAVATIASRFAIRHVASALDLAPSEKQSALASGISTVMSIYLVAFVAVVLAAIVLAYASVRARAR